MNENNNKNKAKAKRKIRKIRAEKNEIIIYIIYKGFVPSGIYLFERFFAHRRKKE